MSETLFFRRIICPAESAITFESQIAVYASELRGGEDPELVLRKLTTANVGIFEGHLVADFSLGTEEFSSPEEVVLSSVIARGAPDTDTGHDALKITGIAIGLRWPPPTP